MSSEIQTEKPTLNKTFDDCLANFLVKGGLGFTAGIALSLFFKRKAFPIAGSTGFGLGIAQNQCQSNYDKITYELHKT